jgi:hypothetical protein
MAYARHQLTRVRARVGDELVSGVPQVVKVNTSDSGTLTRASQCEG